MTYTDAHPTRFKQFRTQLHDIFNVEKLPEQTQERYGVDSTIDWTAKHEQLVSQFAEAMYNSDPYENYSYVEIYEHYQTTLETEETPESLNDRHLETFAHTLLDNPVLAEEFLTRLSNTFIVQLHERDSIEAPEQ